MISTFKRKIKLNKNKIIIIIIKILNKNKKRKKFHKILNKQNKGNQIKIINNLTLFVQRINNKKIKLLKFQQMNCLMNFYKIQIACQRLRIKK